MVDPEKSWDKLQLFISKVIDGIAQSLMGYSPEN